MKLLKNEKTPILRNYLTLPLQLNAETDEKLLVATEGRVPSFSHDFVPNMLRTKPEPDVEQKHQALENKMAQVNSDTAQVGLLSTFKFQNTSIILIYILWYNIIFFIALSNY